MKALAGVARAHFVSLKIRQDKNVAV